MEWVFAILFIIFCTWALGLRRKAELLRKDFETQAAIFEEARKAKESELAHRDEMYNFLLNGMSDGVLIIDKNLTVTYSNKRVRKQFGITRDPAGTPLIQALFDHRIVEVVKKSIETNTWENRNILVADAKPGGKKERYFRIKAAPLTYPEDDESTGGKLEPALEAYQSLTRVIIRDETIRHETEQIRKDFVANASHELRTPLSIINGYIENLLDGALENRKMARRFLEIMSKHGERITRIVDGMLTISKLESPSDELFRREPFDLKHCLDDVLDRLGPIIDEKNSLIETDFPKGPIILTGDCFHWDQIFFNLVENALKQNNEKLIIRIGLEDRGDHFCITVMDNGVGIPASSLPFIFKRFYRVEKHHNQRIKGTGLGLSIVKRAVEAHGGKINVTSIPGAATTFKILVPKESLSQNTVVPLR